MDLQTADNGLQQLANQTCAQGAAKAAIVTCTGHRCAEGRWPPAAAGAEAAAFF